MSSLLVAAALLLLCSGAGEEAEVPAQSPPALPDKCPALDAEDAGLSLRHIRAERRQSISSQGVDLPGSCKTIGCGYYRRSKPCQCNRHCRMFGNCCPDYASFCGSPGSKPRRKEGAVPATIQFGGCAFYGCNNSRPATMCQCQDTCREKKTCCPDFEDMCIRSPSSRPMTPEAEKYLGMVDAYLDSQPRQQFLSDGVGLMQTFGPGNLGGGPCEDEDCKLPKTCPEEARSGNCRVDTYDNAVAAIYYTKRGRLTKARNILRAFLHFLYPKPGSNVSGPAWGAEQGLPSGRTLTPLVNSYTLYKADPGQYEGKSILDGGVDVGNNAWAGLAFAHFASASGEACYATVARDILWVLARGGRGCEDDLQGFMARLPPYPGKYRSTEHNTDLFALARILSDYDTQARASMFVQSMYGYDKRYKHSYTMGTAGDSTCDAEKRPAPVACDAQFWNLLADVDPQQDRKKASLAAALQPAEHGGMLTWDSDLIGNGTSLAGQLEGLRFSNWGHGVQWENTASAVMAMSLYRQRYGEQPATGLNLSLHISGMRRSILQLMDVYGKVPSSVLGGNIGSWYKNDHTTDYPGGSDTGIGWTYLRYPHVASSAWAGLMLLFRDGEHEPVNQDANPFAPPSKGQLPSAKDVSCLPQ